MCVTWRRYLVLLAFLLASSLAAAQSVQPSPVDYPKLLSQALNALEQAQTALKAADKRLAQDELMFKQFEDRFKAQNELFQALSGQYDKLSKTADQLAKMPRIQFLLTGSVSLDQGRIQPGVQFGIIF